MTVIHNQLVLVWGYNKDGGARSKKLGVWRADLKSWTHPYPEICTQELSFKTLTSVEVLNTDTSSGMLDLQCQHHHIPNENSCLDDMYYFMGGRGGESQLIKNVLSMSLQALIRYINSKPGDVEEQVWKELPKLQLFDSAPLSISGSLLAVGGRNEDGEASTAIRLYQPVTGEWVKVGDMFAPRYS